MKKMWMIMMGLLMLFGCAKRQREVVLYCCLDEIYSHPIVKGFEERTGIKVKASWDTEATKTTGLVNKLIAEKNHPICDVFWNNELGQTIILKNNGILAPYSSASAKDIPEQFKDREGYWTGFAARARVIIYNTDLVKEEVPKSMYDFLNPKWKGKIAMAKPLFGTTATHSAALFAFLGEEKAKKFFADLQANDVIIADGNAHVKDQVADGEIAFGLTDTDDANLALLDEKPVKIVHPDQDSIGTLVIPNSIALIKNCPHPEEAKLLIDYLLSPEVEEKLAFGRSVQMPLHPGVRRPDNVPAVESIKAMEVDFEEIGLKMRATSEYLKETFLR